MAKIGIIGSGNVAFHLAKAFAESGNPADLIAVRNKSHALEFPNQSSIIDTIDLSAFELDLIILAVSDNAISEVIKSYQFPKETLVVHTSGSQPMDLFEQSAIKNFGVLYPLQTFSRQKEIDYSQLQFFLETNSQKNTNKLLSIASLISNHVSTLNSKKRLKLHLAAVIANNFSNFLLSVAEDQLKQANLSLDVLAPLIQETTEKALTIGPASSQTGPAVRGDHEVIDRHLKILEDQPEIREVYDLLTKLIAEKLKH